MQKASDYVVVFLIVTPCIIFLLASLVITSGYFYRKKANRVFERADRFNCLSL